MLEVRNVHLTQRDEKILRGIDFTLPDRTGLLVTGKNESEKLALARICAGLLEPDQGTVRFDDQPIQECRPRVEYIHQHSGLLQNRSVLENIVMKVRYHPELAKYYDPDQIERLLDRFHLTDLQTKLPFELNPVQRRRVALARTFLSHPDLIIINVPGLNIDELEILNFIEHMHEKKEEDGTSFLMVTNRVVPEFNAADRIAVLEDGRIDAIGPVDRMQNHHRIRRIIQNLQVFGYDNES